MLGSVLTLEECARELKVSTQDVLTLIDKKELHAKKIGSQYRIPISNFCDYLNLPLPHASPKSSIDFSSWADKWLEIYKKPNVTENTYQGTYLLYVEKHLKPYFGSADLNDIKPVKIQQFYSSKRNLSESALSKIKICLNGIFETAIDNELCNKNPTQFVSAKSEKIKSLKRVYTNEQEEIIRSLSIRRLPGIVLSLETGIRPGEFTGIRWTDIKDGVLHIDRSIAYSKTKKFIIRPPKWDSYRDIPLTPWAKLALHNMKNDDIYIFPQDKNTPYTPRAWDKIVQRFFGKMLEQYYDIPHLTPHEFRHTFGTKLRRNGVDIYTIQKLMGHKTIKVTTETYVHNEIDVLKNALGL